MAVRVNAFLDYRLERAFHCEHNIGKGVYVSYQDIPGLTRGAVNPICIHIHAYMHIHIHAHTHLSMYLHTHSLTHTRTHIHNS